MYMYIYIYTHTYVYIYIYICIYIQVALDEWLPLEVPEQGVPRLLQPLGRGAADGDLQTVTHYYTL